MSKQITLAVKSALASAILATSSAAVAGTVDSSTEPFNGGFNSIGAMGDSLIATEQAASAHSYTDNPDLKFSSWGHEGRWYNFEVTAAINTKINVVADNLVNWSPAFTVYRTEGEWGGGTATFVESTLIGNTPHNFNSTGDIGDPGTLWMQKGAAGNNSSYSNAVATLAYANSGIAHGSTETNWGEDIQHGVNAKAGLLLYSDGMTGSVGMGTAEITLANLSKGWYTIYAGGADASKRGSTFSVEVSAVPIPAAAYLFGTGLIGLFAGRIKSFRKT